MTETTTIEFTPEEKELFEDYFYDFIAAKYDNADQAGKAKYVDLIDGLEPRVGDDVIVFTEHEISELCSFLNDSNTFIEVCYDDMKDTALGTLYDKIAGQEGG